MSKTQSITGIGPEFPGLYKPGNPKNRIRRKAICMMLVVLSNGSIPTIACVS